MTRLAVPKFELSESDHQIKEEDRFGRLPHCKSKEGIYTPPKAYRGRKLAVFTSGGDSQGKKIGIYLINSVFSFYVRITRILLTRIVDGSYTIDLPLC